MDGTQLALTELGELDIDLMLASLPPEEAEVIEPTEAGDDTAIVELSAEDEQAVDALVERTEAYEGQAASEMIAEAPALPPAIEAPAAGKKARTKKAATVKTPRVSINDLAADHFILSNATPAGADLEVLKADVLATRPTQVKIAEKFDNLLISLANGKRPSIYIMDCFAALDAKKVITSIELIAAISATTSNVGTTKGSAKAHGTAASQVGQIMNLFNTLGIGARAGNTLTLNSESRLAGLLRAL